jgi:hypothetical protein
MKNELKTEKIANNIPIYINLDGFIKGVRWKLKA